MLSRSEAVRNKNVAPEIAKKRNIAQKKWSQFQAAADAVLPLALSGVSDVRVSPLIQSRWSQQTVCGNHCYDYYTYFGSTYYPCGCVATAMAQLMKFHNYPTAGVGTGSSTIYVNDVSRTAYLRGGNGAGGPYDWAQMTLIPDCSTTASQRTAIAAICADAGTAAHMSYGITGSVLICMTPRPH